MATLTATGVIVRVRASGAEYGMHDECADALISAIVATGYSVLSDDMPAVIIGPLFAPADEWTCAHSDCAHR